MIATQTRPTALVQQGTMQAAIRRRYGSADLVHLEEIDRPTPKPGQVLVHVQAAGVDRGVSHLMTGKPYLTRIAGFGRRAPKNRVRGGELAGTVEAIGMWADSSGACDLVSGDREGACAVCGEGRA